MHSDGPEARAGFEAANEELEGAVPALLEVGDLKMASRCLIAHGLIARFGGQAEDAERHYGEAFELCVKGGSRELAGLPGGHRRRYVDLRYHDLHNDDRYDRRR